MARTVLAVDGNSIVHRAFHAQAGTGLRTVDGRPMWAVRGLVAQLLAAVERLDPACVVVGFDDPDASERKQRWPQYKAARADKLETLVDQLALARDVVAELGFTVVVPTGLEADDVLASTARTAGAAGDHAVLMTSDRDSFALIDETTSVLRIINGGVEASPLLTPDRLVLLLGIRPEQYRDYAALRGDPSDCLPGVRGFGPKTAARLLAALGSAEAAFADAAAGAAAVTAAVGAALARRLVEPDARAAWALNCQVMALRSDVPIALADVWPLAGETVRDVFARLQMPASLPKALRIFADEDAPDALERIAWSRPAERWADRRMADSGPARFPALPKRVDDAQPALFGLDTLRGPAGGVPRAG